MNSKGKCKYEADTHEKNPRLHNECDVAVASTDGYGRHHNVPTGNCWGQALKRGLGSNKAQNSQSKAGAYTAQTKYPRDNEKAAGPVNNCKVSPLVKHLAVYQ